MIKNIVFDIGNVLTDYRWKEFLADKGFDGPMIERIGRSSTQHPLWNEYDRGVWSDEEILQSFVDEDPEIEAQLRKAYEDFTGLVVKREFAIPWIRQLKKEGYGVYYLSNFSRKAHAECADALDFIPYMDGGLLSYQERLIKPDPAIYRLLLSRYGLAAYESVFLDDTLKNVKGAEAAGMYGIHFLSQEQAQQALLSLQIG